MITKELNYPESTDCTVEKLQYMDRDTETYKTMQN